MLLNQQQRLTLRCFDFAGLLKGHRVNMLHDCFTH
jgi:hypothetical protein